MRQVRHTHSFTHTNLNIYVDTRTQCLNSRLKGRSSSLPFSWEKKEPNYTTVQKIVFKEIKDMLILKFKAEFSTAMNQRN